MIQSSWTIDNTLAGTYTVKIIATLTRSSSTPTTMSTNNFVITIDACNPLPCKYNYIIAPDITGTLATVNHLPST